MNYDYYLFGFLLLWWLYQIRNDVDEIKEISNTLERIDTTLSEIKEQKEIEIDTLRSIKNELNEMRLGEWKPTSSEKEN